MEHLVLFVACVYFINNYQAIIDIIKIGPLQLAMMEYVAFEAVRGFIDHITFPASIAHTCDNSHICGIYNELVIDVSAYNFGNFDHQAISADLSLLLNTNNAAVVSVEQVYDTIGIFNLIRKDILGSGLVVPFKEQSAISRFCRLVRLLHFFPPSRQ